MDAVARQVAKKFPVSAIGPAILRGLGKSRFLVGWIL
jgi:hypothetical protein